MKGSTLHGTIMLSMVTQMIGPYDGPGAITRKLAAAADAVLNLEKLSKTSNPMETEAAHARRVAAAAKQLGDKISRLETEIATEATSQRDRLQREIKEKARLVPSQNAKEIREALRAMPEKERSKTMIEALHGSDTGVEILAAVADGNLITTGLSDDVRSRFIAEHQKMQAPELFKELTALDEVVEHAPKIVEIAKQVVNEAVSPSYIEQINAAEKASTEAVEAFNQSVY